MSSVSTRLLPGALLRSPLLWLNATALAALLALMAFGSSRERAGGVVRPSLQPSPGQRSATFAVSLPASWTFSPQLPSGWWRSAAASSVSTRLGSAFTTSGEPGAYQIQSPAFALATGEYSIVLTGQIKTGGLTLGVLDPTTGRWYAYSNYRGAETGLHAFVVTAAVPTGRDAVITIANFAGAKVPVSRWLIHDVSLQANAPNTPYPIQTPVSRSG